MTCWIFLFNWCRKEKKTQQRLWTELMTEFNFKKSSKSKQSDIQSKQHVWPLSSVHECLLFSYLSHGQIRLRDFFSSTMLPCQTAQIKSCPVSAYWQNYKSELDISSWAVVMASSANVHEFIGRWGGGSRSVNHSNSRGAVCDVSSLVKKKTQKKRIMNLSSRAKKRTIQAVCTSNRICGKIVMWVIL